MSAVLGKVPEPVGWAGNRNIIVPPDIIPVRRVSPIPKKKRTPCRPRPDGELICRAGNREWFSDRLFVEVDSRDLRTACGTSMTAHASCLVGLLVLLAGQPTSTTAVDVSSPLRMPAFVALMSSSGSGAGDQLTFTPPERVPPPAKGRVVKAEPPKKASSYAPEPNPVAPEPQPESEQSRPTEDPQKEIEDTHDNSTEETNVGAPDGVTGGVPESGETTAGGANGKGNGAGSGGDGSAGVGGGTSGAGKQMSAGPYRLGNGIEPPRKIKHVAPVYPAGALASRALGTVAIEAIVDADGKIRDAKIVHSIADLDQAALDAVRQWEFAPSRLNGVAVAVIVTVVVQFSIY